jgi:hypothetical protein
MKKKDERLNSIHDIIKSLKVRSRDYTGSKEIVMRNKIAVVWYMEADRKILSHIVDEAELKAIMAARLTEILCLQTYIGGQYFRGNGVFEHRMWTQKDGSIKHITYESINMQRDCTDRFTCDSEKLVVTEHRHGALSAIAKQLMTHMAFLNKCKVTGMIFLAVFSEGWVPHVVAAKKFTFANVAFDLEDQREEMVYPTGRAPSAPTINPQSLLLPRSFTDYTLRRASAMQRSASIAPVASTQHGVPAAPPDSSPAPLMPQSTVPPPNDAEATPNSTQSRKVRSSSLSYAGSTRYPHLETEQERRAAQLSRQVSARSEMLMNDAVEEAKAMSTGETGEFAVSGKYSSKLSPSGQRSASAKYSPSRASGKFGRSGSAVGAGILSKGLMRAHSEVGFEPDDLQEMAVTHTESGMEGTAGATSSKVPTKSGASTAEHTTEPTSNTAEQPPLRRTTLQSSSAKVISRSQLNFTYNQPSLPATPTAQTSPAAAAAPGSEGVVARDGAPPHPLKRAMTLGASTFNAAPVRTVQAFGPSSGTASEEGKSELRIPPTDPTREPSRVNYNSEDYYATVHMGAKPSALHQLQASKSVRPPTAAVAETTPLKAGVSGKLQSTAGATGKVPSSEAGHARKGSTKSLAPVTTTTATGATYTGTGNTCDYPSTGRTSPIVRTFRPASASSLAKLHHTIDKVKTVYGASSGQLGTSVSAARRSSTGAGGNQETTERPFKLEAFEMNTEVSAAHTSYHRSAVHDDEVACKVQEKVFADRRPISAPHTL